MNKFKSGDKIICVSVPPESKMLTYGKVYEVLLISIARDKIKIVGDSGNQITYSASWFKHLSEYRNELIDGILE